MRANGVREVQLAYHGSDDPERHGIARTDLPGLHLYAPQPPAQPFRGTMAVAPNLLLGIFYPPGQSPYDRLRGRRPDARAGVFFVFRDVEGDVEDLSKPR
jgi:hypothetical protein